MEQLTCYKCFHPLNHPGFCPKCGYNNSAYHPQPHYLLPGTVLHGRYLLGTALGEGGFGITYSGFDTALDRRVAVKEFFPQGSVWRESEKSAEVSCLTSSSQQLIFKNGKLKSLQEAKSLAKLDDIGAIVRVLDFFEENNTAYIIMEYVEGVTLKAYAKRSSETMSPEEAVTLLLPVMHALKIMHRRGFVHRDISPDNIMLPPAGDAKLLDFGAVKAVTDVAGNATEHPVVKRGFSPIELYSNKGLIGPWSDVYAMCATIFYLVTGKPLPEPVERMENDTVIISALRGKLSPALQTALLHGLSIQPGKRCQSMDELIDSLTAALRQEQDNNTTSRAAGGTNAYTKTAGQRAPFEDAPGKTLLSNGPGGRQTVAHGNVAPILTDNRDASSGRPEGDPGDTASGTTPSAARKTVVIAVSVLLVLTAAIFAGRHFFKKTDKEGTNNASSQEAALLAHGACGKDADNVTWELDETGTLMLSGNGETASYQSNKEVPWADHREQIKDIRVEEGVTALGSRTFAECTNAKSVSLPESLQTIGSFCFQSCSSVSDYEIPASTTSISAYAFDTCKNIASFTVAAANAQYKSIDDALYSSDGKTLCHVPSAIDGAFTVPEGVESILEDAFCCSALSSVVFPKSLKTIEKYAFDDCNQLKNLTVSAENPFLTSENNVIFSKDKKTLVLFPKQYAGSAYEIPASVEAVADTAFGNTNLTEIVFPTSVKQIYSRIVSQSQSDITLTFRGAAPATDGILFNSRHAISIRYPANAAGWTDLIALDTDHTIQWTPIG